MKVSRLSWSSLLLNLVSSSTTLNTARAVLTSNLPEDPQFFDELCDGSGGERPKCKENHVLVDIPESCVEPDGSSDCPIVFFFHGAGGTNKWFPKLSGIHSENLIGVYPQGEDGWNTGPKSSNSCDWTDFDCQDDPNETQFIFNIINSLTENGANGNVYLIGNSNGAALTYRVAVNASSNHRIKAIIAKVTQLLADPEQSGPGPDNYNIIQPGSTPKISVLNIMGSADGVIPYEGGSSPVFGDHNEFQLMDAYDSIVTWALHNDCDETPITSQSVTDHGTGYATKYEFQNCAEDKRVVHYNIDGGGHDAGGATVDGRKIDYDLIYDFIHDLEDSAPPAPSPAPTPGSGEICTDDPTWHGKYNVAHNCAYVAENLARCNWENSDGEKAQDKCRHTCDPDCANGDDEEQTSSPTFAPTFAPTDPPTTGSDCADDPNWSGYVNPAHNCDYVAQYPSGRCKWKNSEGEIAEKKCPVSCGTC